MLRVITNTYALAMLYFVLPGLVGILFEVYIGIPGRHGRNADVTSVLHVWDAW